MTIRLDEPLYLGVLALLLPMGIVAWRWFSGIGAARKWSAIVLRAVLLCLLIGMVAGASMVQTSDRAAVVALVDVSGSVKRFVRPGVDLQGRPVPTDESIRAFLAAASGSRRPDDISGVIVFDAQPAVASAPGSGFGFSGDVELREGTDIERAIGLGAAMLPPGTTRRLVLFSDGVSTAGDAERAARAAGVPIDVVPLDYRVEREVIVESVDSPPTAPAGSSVPVRVVLSSAGESSGTLRLIHEDRPVPLEGGETGLRMTLSPGQTVRRAIVPLGDGRVHRFEAVWEPDDPDADTILANNRASSFTVAPGKGSVLVVDGVSGADASGPGATLPAALRSAGMDVEVVSAEGLRAELLWLQAFDLIVLQNVGADAVPERTQEALVSYVSQLGGGLIMVGGPESFGAGGWKGSTLEPILPVLLDLPERLVVPAMAVVLVIDNSGSMNRSVMGSDRSQMQIAGEGAAAAVLSMDKTDLVGVISFNSDYTVEIPLGPNTDPKAAAEKIRSIGADGGTFLPPALEQAQKQLRSSQAEIKHIIVLSDGVSMGKERLNALAQSVARDNVRLTTIAVGDDSDGKVMADMASIGGGQFYRVTDPSTLPRIFLRAVRIVRSPLIRETPFTPVPISPGSPVLEGLGTLPPLGGLVLTQPRAEPTVVSVLVAPSRAGTIGGGEPVLSYWSAGLGRVAAFTSDAHRWAAGWVASSEGVYAGFWTQLVRTVARPPTSRTQILTLDAAGDRITARLEATSDDGRPLDLLDVPASIYSPSGRRLDLRLQQIGPGQYEAASPAGAASDPGVYVVTLAPRQGTRALAPVIGGVSRPTGPEFRRLTSDRAALERIAAASGGRVLSLSDPSAADLFSRVGVEPAQSRTSLWRLLAIWAIAVMLLDVATRRVAWDRLLSRQFGTDVKRRAAEAVQERGGKAEVAVRRLRDRDEQTTIAAASQPTPGPLTDADALAIARAEQVRRKAAREDARRAAAAPGPAAPIVQVKPPMGSDDTDTGGLLAAKRRARQKMDED